MPIVDVEIVGPRVEASTTQRLADELGHVFKARKGGLRVRVRCLPREHYAENHDPAPAPPVFVTIFTREPPAGDALLRRIAFVTEAVARVTGRDPRHVHILFESTRGRIAFGGEIT